MKRKVHRKEKIRKVSPGIIRITDKPRGGKPRNSMVDSMVNTADALNLLGRPLENADIRLNRKMNAEKIGLKALKLPKIENPRCKRLNLPDVGTLGHILVPV